MTISNRAITARKASRTSIQTLEKGDNYGKRSIEATHALLGERRERLFTSSRTNLYHRTANGPFDPFTYFHLVNAIASVKPYAEFTAHNLADTWAEANGDKIFQPLVVRRTWQGKFYELTADAPARAVLLNLIEDLSRHGKKILDGERAGEPWRKLVSPLQFCPSVMELDETA